MDSSRKLKYNDKNYYAKAINLYTDDFSTVLSALDVVKEFIISNKLIITGGMAIDYALRLHGDRIYDDDQLPDYDFYSPNHWSDAYKLGSILCEKKYKNIRVIQALNIVTMRVQMDGITLADVSFLPDTIFNHLPTISYIGFKIIHPHYQMIDQHSSLSRPFDNPGKEVIFSRWEKDMKRYDLLYKYYPVVLDSGITYNITAVRNRQISLRNVIKRSPGRDIMSLKLEIPLSTIRIKLKDIKDLCIVGWCSIDYIIEGEYIIFNIPSEEPLSFASQNYENHLNILTDYKFYNGYGDKLPRHILGNSSISDIKKKIELFDISGLKLSATKISEKYNIYVCNIQWSMLYLMIKILYNKNKRVVFTAEEQYLYCRQLVKVNDERHHNPNTDMYGNINPTFTHIISLKKYKEQIYQIKTILQQPGNIKYTKGCDISKYSFDYNTSPYYQEDMREVAGFIKYNIDSYPDYTRECRV